MTKREFMIQYILNRAQGHAGGMMAEVVLKEAEIAWNYILLKSEGPPYLSNGDKK